MNREPLLVPVIIGAVLAFGVLAAWFLKADCLCRHEACVLPTAGRDELCCLFFIYSFIEIKTKQLHLLHILFSCSV